MKTSIVINRFGSRGFVRACIPEDGPDALAKTPSYIPAHQANGQRSDGRTTWAEPEAVNTCAGIHRPERGKVRDVRRLDVASVAALEAIDAERDQLKARLFQLGKDEQDILETAYPAAKPISLDDAKAWREVKQAARAAAPSV